MRTLLRSTNKNCIIAVKEVEDPSQHGVVVTEQDGSVIKYFDKPVEYISNQINAGIYCFKASLLDDPQMFKQGYSLEREVLPQLITEGHLHSQNLRESYWMDIGMPHNFIKGTVQYLDHLEQQNRYRLDLESDIGQKESSTGFNLKGNIQMMQSDSESEIGKLGNHSMADNSE